MVEIHLVDGTSSTKYVIYVVQCSVYLHCAICCMNHFRGKLLLEWYVRTEKNGYLHASAAVASLAVTLAFFGT